MEHNQRLALSGFEVMNLRAGEFDKQFLWFCHE
jgi:hypothetical protein